MKKVKGKMMSPIRRKKEYNTTTTKKKSPRFYGIH